MFTNPQVFHQIDAAKVFIIPPGSYELTDIADIIKQETNNKILLQVDKNTMKCKMEVLQGVFNFHVENSVASLLGFDEQTYSRSKYTTNKIFDLMVSIQLIFIAILYQELKIMVKIQIY